VPEQVLLPAWELEEGLLVVVVQEEAHLAVVVGGQQVAVACQAKEGVEKVVRQKICSFFVVAYTHLYLVGCNTTLEPYHK